MFAKGFCIPKAKVQKVERMVKHHRVEMLRLARVMEGKEKQFIQDIQKVLFDEEEDKLKLNSIDEE
jgi:hypothetical protein